MNVTPNKPDKPPRGTGPSWVMPSLVTLGAVSFSYAIGRNKMKSELNKEKKANPAEPQATAETPKTLSGSLITSGEEALTLIKDGSYSKVVSESISQGGTFSYEFKKSGDNSESAFLRGVLAGPERTKLIEELKEAGATTVAVISEAPSAPVILPQPAQANPWWEAFIWPTLVVTGVILLFRKMKSAGSGMFPQLSELNGNSNLRQMIEKPKERFSDVGGNRSLLSEMMALKEKIADVQAGAGQKKAKLPTGVLMTGDPGTGKTFMARVLSGEADCPFFYLNAGDLCSSSYIGAWTRAVKTFYAQARAIRDQQTTELRSKLGANGNEQGVVLVFLDEFDSIGINREERSNHQEQRKAVNALLQEMDGVDQKQNLGIILIAATNSFQLDPALTRPGRFTVKMKVELPRTVGDRLEILRKVALRVSEEREIEQIPESLLKDLAMISDGCSPDHLKGIVDRASDLALRRKTEQVLETDVYEAFQEVLFGFRGVKSHDDDRISRVAEHELGHGILAEACGRSPLVVSMTPRGNSLGRVVIDDHPLREELSTREDLLKALLILAGGRAAEIEFRGVQGATAGVQSDFEIMGKVARLLIDNGMIGSSYRLSSDKAESWELPEDIKIEVENICKQALECASKIINLIPKEKQNDIVKEMLAQENEIVGSAAKNFIKKNIPSDILQKQAEMVEEFCKNPGLCKN